MSIEAESHDGVIHEFPDNTSPDVINAAMKKYVAAPVDGGAKPTSDGPMAWGDVAEGAAENLLPSAVSTVKSMATSILHPVKTVESLYDTATGYMEKALPKSVGPHGNEQYANALNSYLADRYGGMENLKRSVANDPVGVATDIATIFAGGEGALARAAEVGGKVGEVAETAGKISGSISRGLNPINLAAKGIKAIPKGVGDVSAELIGRLGTHTGSKPLKLAYEAGAAGGDAQKTFLDNLRDKVPAEDAVQSAKAAVNQMRSERQGAYRSGMLDISGDKTVLSFDPLDKKITTAASIKNFKGVDIAPKTAAVRGELNEIIENWKNLDPAEYHTPEGFDALKQQIGDLKESLPYNTPQRLVADHAYNAVRNTITEQAPKYAEVMKDYTDASKEIEEMEKTLSLNRKASVDTALRKLQSIMRSDVNTNFGAREHLGKTLAKHGAPNLEYQLAGQTLNAPFARGLGAYEGAATVIGALGSGHYGVLAALPFMSPRLMGEVANAMGRVSKTKIPSGLPSAALGAYGADTPLRAQDNN